LYEKIKNALGLCPEEGTLWGFAPNPTKTLFEKRVLESEKL
jgi:hypothetical protein